MLLGVLTKPDMVEPSAEGPWLDILEGRRHRLNLGYYVTKHPSQKELNDGLTGDQARASEAKWFSNNTWRIDPNRAGTQKLETRMSELLVEQMKRR
jgi:hypothetical protein